MERTPSVFAAIYRDDPYQRTRLLLGKLSGFISRPVFTAPVQGQILAARDLMLQAHFAQAPRPEGQPYINHPLEVALAVATDLGCERSEVVIAALLHDVVEDQAALAVSLLGGEATAEPRRAALDALGRRFGERVAELVARLTNPDFARLAAAGTVSGETIAAAKNRLYKEHVLDIYAGDPEAFAVKFADLSCNALRLDQLQEGRRKDRLRAKYGPVLVALSETLARLEELQHPLYQVKDRLVERLKATYRRDYQRDSL